MILLNTGLMKEPYNWVVVPIIVLFSLFALTLLLPQGA